MKKKMINKTHVEGLLYEHNLKLKKTGAKSKHPGTDFISGTIDIATDDECTNIVQIHFTYVTAETAKGAANANFDLLNGIIEGTHKSIMEHGKENACMLRVDSAIGLTDFYADRNGKEELVSLKQNEGGFIHLTNSLNEKDHMRNTFECDMVITGVFHIEEDDERKTPEKALVKGAIFNFRNALLPVEFTAINPGGIDYFESLGVSEKNPVFTKIWGVQISKTIVKTYSEESAFGEASVHEVENSYKDYVITGASAEPYEWDDESTLTANELTEAMAERETFLATVKQRREEYKNSLADNANAIAATPASPDKSTFEF